VQGTNEGNEGNEGVHRADRIAMDRSHKCQSTIDELYFLQGANLKMKMKMKMERRKT
jgi:hypothetical protein